MMALWLLTFLIVGFGAFTQSVTGFGFALLSAPVLLVILGPHTTVIVVLLLHSVECSLILLREWRSVEGFHIAPLLAGTLLGTPIGIGLFQYLDAGALQLWIGVLIAASGLLLLLPPRPFPAERLGSVIAGFTSGLLNSGTGLSGPPLALYLGNQGWDRRRFRTAL